MYAALTQLSSPVKIFLTVPSFQKMSFLKLLLVLCYQNSTGAVLTEHVLSLFEI